MRSILIAILVVIVGVGLFIVLKPSAPSDVQSAKIGSAAASSTAPVATTTPAVPNGKQVALKSFTFTGYGPGKSHDGTFTETSVSNVSLASNGVPTAGRFTIKTASVKTDSEKLDGHLCTEDFFNCQANPEIVFDLTAIAVPRTPYLPAPYDVSGKLTFNGVTQDIAFPVTVQADGTFSADFKIDTTFFNFKYVGIDKEVRVQFSGEIK